MPEKMRLEENVSRRSIFFLSEERFQENCSKNYFLDSCISCAASKSTFLLRIDSLNFQTQSNMTTKMILKDLQYHLSNQYGNSGCGVLRLGTQN